MTCDFTRMQFKCHRKKMEENLRLIIKKLYDLEFPEIYRPKELVDFTRQVSVRRAIQVELASNPSLYACSCGGCGCCSTTN